jgi:hypothetical protein
MGILSCLSSTCLTDYNDDLVSSKLGWGISDAHPWFQELPGT